MTEDDDQQPWIVEEADDQLLLCHDHRWLAIFGIPLATIGTAAAIGVWLVPGIDRADAAPLLCVGSLMGIGVILMGLHLSLNRVFFIADRKRGEFIQTSGFGPFTRMKTCSLDDIEEVICTSVPGNRNYALMLRMEQKETIIAMFVESEPIQIEGLRWSIFLACPLIDRISNPRN